MTETEACPYGTCDHDVYSHDEGECMFCSCPVCDEHPNGCPAPSPAEPLCESDDCQMAGPHAITEVCPQAEPAALRKQRDEMLRQRDWGHTVNRKLVAENVTLRQQVVELEAVAESYQRAMVEREDIIATWQDSADRLAAALQGLGKEFLEYAEGAMSETVKGVWLAAADRVADAKARLEANAIAQEDA